MFRDIALAERPLEELVRFALLNKGAEPRPEAVSRYVQMLDTAIRMDDGEKFESDMANYIGSLSGRSRFEALVSELGAALGAAPVEIDQFLTVTDAVTAVLDGQSVERVEAGLAKQLGEDAPQFDDDSPYAHLDPDTAELKRLQDEANRAPDPNKPEPNHIDTNALLDYGMED